MSYRPTLVQTSQKVLQFSGMLSCYALEGSSNVLINSILQAFLRMKEWGGAPLLTTAAAIWGIMGVMWPKAMWDGDSNKEGKMAQKAAGLTEASLIFSELEH